MHQKEQKKEHLFQLKKEKIVTVFIWAVPSGGPPHLHPREALSAGDVRRLHVTPGPLCGHHRRHQPGGPHGPVCGVLPHLLPRGPQGRHRQEALQPHHRRDLPLLLEGPQAARGLQGALTGDPRPGRLPGPLPSALCGGAGVPPPPCVWLLC